MIFGKLEIIDKNIVVAIVILPAIHLEPHVTRSFRRFHRRIDLLFPGVECLQMPVGGRRMRNLIPAWGIPVNHTPQTGVIYGSGPFVETYPVITGEIIKLGFGNNHKI